MKDQQGEGKSDKVTEDVGLRTWECEDGRSAYL